MTHGGHKKINAVLDVKLNKPAIIYHCIQGFINMIQGETDLNDTFKLLIENIYETMKLSGVDNIICSKKLTKNGIQTSTKDKQALID